MSHPNVIARAVQNLIAAGFPLQQAVRLVAVGSGRSRSDVLFAYQTL